MWFQNLEAAEHTVSRNESNCLFKCIKVSFSFSLCDPFPCEFCFVFCNSQSCVSLSTISFETFVCICGIHLCFAHRSGPWILHLQHALPPNEKALDSGYLAPVVFLWAWKEMVSLGAREQEWCKSLQDLDPSSASSSSSASPSSSFLAGVSFGSWDLRTNFGDALSWCCNYKISVVNIIKQCDLIWFD